jgi:membrane protease YdiL (CAAX protease family)
MATRWGLFAGATVIVLLVVLGLSRATARELSGTGDAGAGPTSPPPETRACGPMPDDSDGSDAADTAPELRPRAVPPAGGSDLLLSATLSQALVGTLLVGLAWYAEVPASAFGIEDPAGALLPGVALGAVLSAANEAGAWIADRLGFDADETLRDLLAPDSRGEWALLLLVVLPVVAGVEELLFRGALIGAFAAGFAISPWVLAVLSSVAFGLGHGLQGPGGVLVTGVLGFALAAAFVVTGSLWVVIVAHYLVNAIEFVVHEGLRRD